MKSETWRKLAFTSLLSITMAGVSQADILGGVAWKDLEAGTDESNLLTTDIGEFEITTVTVNGSETNTGGNFINTNSSGSWVGIGTGDNKQFEEGEYWEFTSNIAGEITAITFSSSVGKGDGVKISVGDDATIVYTITSDHRAVGEGDDWLKGDAKDGQDPVADIVFEAGQKVRFESIGAYRMESITFEAIPEPASFVLLGIGSLLLTRRRK
ncbi:PEP-CTERM sorting domain-containing protein [Planctomycetota bacterium]|nr:PEP-CTERM sorting domain-containing protein [Planctomycetota bacterium]